MQDVKIGQVVKVVEGFYYLVESGSTLGELRLIPITSDSSRQILPLTPELKATLKPY